MNTKTQKVPSAIKNECTAPNYMQVIKRLKAEKALVTTELSTMTPDAWLNVRGRALANREQELHITLDVLARMAQQPVQIQEPTH
jgi:uncharacterized membrane protein YcgQ (UPF0703/DUF1980 family)